MHPGMGPGERLSRQCRCEHATDCRTDHGKRRRATDGPFNHLRHAGPRRDRELHRQGGSEAGDDEQDGSSPRRRLMGIAAAALGWRPNEYWGSTPHEFWAAFEGWEAMRSEEHTSELQSLMRISYAVFCLKKKP